MGRKSIYLDPAARSQASRVAALFGGQQRLAALLGVSKVTVYRWDHPPVKGGSGGSIPDRHWPAIRSLAGAHGVTLED